ncbi:MAG TPA: hypothetical protein VEI03_03305 [Stellaceae bacterium]|nr:hypothetical protein [Stellaceae bacterium]
MLRLTRSLVVALLLLPAGSCAGVSTWMAGIDRESYSWEPMPGSVHRKTWQQDVKDCEQPGIATGEAAASAPKDGPTIARSEGAAAVAACMADKGYRKVYQARTSFF